MSLPDAVVIDSTVDDMGLVREFLDGSGWLPDPQRSTPQRDPLDPVRVSPVPGVTVNFYFGLGAPITFDFDLGEIQDRRSLDGLLNLIKAVSSITGKDIVITPEGADTGPAVVQAIASTGEIRLVPLGCE
jgi:hypothetical protein